MTDLPILMTERLCLNILSADSAEHVLDYYSRNRNFHQPWFAARNDEIFTVEQQKKNLHAELQDFLAGRALPFWLSLPADPKYIIGRFALTNIIHGCFKSAIASWHLDHTHTNQGYAFEAGKTAINAAFRDYKLHRIEANILPHNSKSIQLAQNLGFELAGYENRYLEINGKWEDHLHFIKLSDGAYHTDEDMPVLKGDNVMLRSLVFDDITCLIEFFSHNKDHIEAFNPGLPENLLSEKYWRHHLLKSRLSWETGQSINFGIFLKDRPERLIGCLDLRDILKAPYNCCELGFSLDHRLTGNGLMLESLNLVLGWIFSHLNINRVHARHVPGNSRSSKLLDIMGFKQEGIQRQAIVTEHGSSDLILKALLAKDFRWLE